MSSDRIIQGRPLNVIWDRDGAELPNRRIEDICRDAADALIMSSSPPQIIIAQVGAPMLWMQASSENLQRFWKGTPLSAYYNTARDHDDLIDKSIKPSYMVYASKWGTHDGSELLLLEMVCWPSAVSIVPD